MLPLESVSRIALIVVLISVTAVVAAPYQELAPRKGYVPVYIRVGDTPLSEIHPGLSEAFREIESADLKLEDGNTLTSKDSSQVESTDSEAPKTEEVEPALEAKTIEEPAKESVESDIASFEVVSGGAVEEKPNTAANTKNAEKEA